MLPVTVILAAMCLFIIGSVVLGMGGDGLDIEIDGDTDFDADGGFLDVFFEFVNADKVPTTIVLFLWIAFTWTVSVIGSYFLNPNGSNLIGIGIVGVSLIVALIITKYAVTPLIPLFKMMKSGENNGEKPEGKQAFVISEEVSEKYGLVEYSGCEGPVRLNAKIREGEKSLLKGDSIVILERSKDGKYYFVAPLKHLNKNI